MPHPPSLLVVVADGAHARFLHQDAAGVLRTVSRQDDPDAHQRTSDLGTDRPGRSFESANPAHHAIAPRHDLHRMAEDAFVRSVAAAVNAAGARGEFAALVLVAPDRRLGLLTEALDRATAAKLLGTLNKDLVKTPDPEMAAHLSSFLAAHHRAGGTPG